MDGGNGVGVVVLDLLATRMGKNRMLELTVNLHLMLPTCTCILCLCMLPPIFMTTSTVYIVRASSD